MSEASFAEAYLVALAELSDVNRVASFDRQIDRGKSVKRVEPYLLSAVCWPPSQRPALRLGLDRQRL